MRTIGSLLPGGIPKDQDILTRAFGGIDKWPRAYQDTILASAWHNYSEGQIRVSDDGCPATYSFFPASEELVIVRSTMQEERVPKR